MINAKFDPDRILGKNIINYGRQELCDLIAKLCEYIKADVGPGIYRGGIYPENISIDENGGVALGPAKREDWKGQELEFLAPELYWNGKSSPASDVYSLGLLLHYAVTGGKLPFDGICSSPQLRRMGGYEFEIPKEAGRRLGEIIGKATRFKAVERYQSMDEMRVMAESCLKNLYLNGEPSAEAIFKKNDDDLTEIEKMMVGIIEKEEDTPIPVSEEEKYDAPAEEAVNTEPEEPLYASEEDEAEEDEPVEETILALKRPLVDDEPEDELEIRIPELYPDEEAELEPVRVGRGKGRTSDVQYTKSAEKTRRSAAEVNRRKRRPVAIILVLCAILIIASILFNALIKDLAEGTQEVQKAAESLAQGDYSALIDDDEPAASAVNITPAPVDSSNDFTDIQPDPEEEPYIPGEEPEEEFAETPAEPAEPVEHGYEVFMENVSWEQASEKCKALGGHLVVINDADEFTTVAELARAQGADYVWIGGHRVNGEMVWEDGSTQVYEKWGYGEPSFFDGNIPEDYVLLWYNRGWVYNDSRNDPCRDYPQMYNGKTAYICEVGD